MRMTSGIDPGGLGGAPTLLLLSLCTYALAYSTSYDDYCNFEGYGVTGKVVDDLNDVADAATCRDHCAAHPACTFFDLNRATEKCTLKDRNSAFVDEAEGEDRVSGPGDCGEKRRHKASGFLTNS